MFRELGCSPLTGDKSATLLNFALSDAKPLQQAETLALQGFFRLFSASAQIVMELPAFGDFGTQ